MLKEFLSAFKNMLIENPNLILEGYIPKEGKYVLVNMEEDDWKISSPIEIKYDKKEQKYIGIYEEKFNFLKGLDYYSNILEMNKPIDNKKTIHSSNYYTFAFKENVFKTKVNEEAIKRYFSILKEPTLKYKDKKARELYQVVEEKIGKVDIDEVEKIEKWLIDNYKYFDIDSESKSYFKVLFVYSNEQKTIEAYKREQSRYELVNIFNNNKSNRVIEGKILGLSNNNMGLNSKKPYITNLDRKISEPYMITLDEAILQKKFFDFLQGYVRNKKYEIYLDSEKNLLCDEKPKRGAILKLFREKNEASIIGYTQITKEVMSVDIIFKEYISEKLSKDEKKLDNQKAIINEKYGRLIERNKVLANIDKVYFYNYLIKNIGNFESVSVGDGHIKNMLMNYGDSILDWYKTDRRESIGRAIDSLSTDNILYSIKNENLNGAISQLNYRISLKNFLEIEKEDIFVDIRSEIVRKINNEEDIRYDLVKDEECLYSIGQIARYLLNQSNIGDKTMDFIQNLLNRKNPEKSKEEILRIIEKYKHHVSVRTKKLNDLIVAVINYEFKEKRANDMWIIAGFLDKNYLYGNKKEEDK